MKRVGRVLHLSPSGRLIVKAEYVPKLGSKILDERLRVVGRVVDVLGPVKSPFIAVKPRKDYRNPAKLSGKSVYMLERRRRR